MQSVLIGMLMTLLSVDSITAQDLADKFEVSKRSIFRYADKLNEAGIPVDTTTGRYGGLHISNSYKIKANYFSKEELARVLAAIKGFSLQDDVTSSAFDKLKALSRARQDFVLQSNQLVVETSVSEEIRDKLNTLQQCVSANKLVQINYHDDKGNDTNRIIEPYCLVLKNGVWYVYAFCRMRSGFRFFKISRIDEMTVQSTEFLPRTFKVDSTKIDTEVLSEKEKIQFILAVDEKSSTHVEEWLGMKSVTRTETGLTAKGEMPFDDYLISKLLSFSDGVKVLHPTKLREKVQHALANISKKYFVKS